MKYIFRIYQWCIAAPILLILTIVTSLITILMTTICGNHFWGYYPAHLWSRCVCSLWGVKVIVKGRENINPSTSYVFVANHQGAFDIWSIYGYLNHDFKWLMKRELEKIFLVGFACRRAGHIMVDESSVSGIRKTIENSEKMLQGGMSLVIFPEGSRTFDGKMIPFKRGAFMLAAEYKLPVVPITIDGAFERMPRTTYNVTPGKIIITIHPPILPGEKGFNTKKLMTECYDTIESALPDSHKNNPNQR